MVSRTLTLVTPSHCTLVASDPATDDFFGAAVALDGPTVLVSTPHPVINGNPYQGAAYFFERLMDDAR